MNWCTPASLNHTFITLILMKKMVEMVTDFRPISLCNILYKIIIKVFANRLKIIFPHVISPTQSVFVIRHLISDNVLVAYELIHFLRKKRIGKDGFIYLKLDISKAYNRVKWSFLDKIMCRMGFGGAWITKIMMCVKSVYFSFLINGEPKGFIKPSRGLHQRDPLSPYLFLQCKECLIYLISKGVETKQIIGIRLCRGAPSINHLLFAKDNVLFYKANMAENKKILDLLKVYEQALRQEINKDKTSFSFSKNTKPHIKRMIKIIFGALQVDWSMQYTLASHKWLEEQKL